MQQFIKKIKELPKLVKLILLLILSFFYVLCFNNFLTLKVNALDTIAIHLRDDYGDYINRTSKSLLNNNLSMLDSYISNILIENNFEYYYLSLSSSYSSGIFDFDLYVTNDLTLFSGDLVTYTTSYTDSGGFSVLYYQVENATKGDYSIYRFKVDSLSNVVTDVLLLGDYTNGEYFLGTNMFSNYRGPDKYNIYIPKNFFLKTNAPLEVFDNIYIQPNTYFEYDYQEIVYNSNGLLLAKGTRYPLSMFLVPTDTEAPILDFAGITTPLEMWQGDTFTVPMPTAYDNVDGDISSNIQVTSTLNPNVVGTYNITYEVCDSSNNCTSATIPITVKNPWVEIDMTAKSAIIFWYKDFTQVLSPNAYCDSIELQGSCFVQKFYYLGRWKYSKVNLNDLDTLLYENGGVYAPLDPAMTDYKNFSHFNIGHTTSDFDSGNEYGVLMYNESGANIVKLKYNQKYFDYRIYNSLNDTEEKEISYIDVDGDNQTTTDVQPPYTQLEDPATVTNSTTAGLFGSFTTNTYGLTAIISAPLNLINQLTSKECTPINLPLPYLDKKFLTLPCMNTFYETYFGSFFSLYQLITFGVVSYWVIVRLLNMIKDFKNPNHDEIEVLDL